MAKKSDRNLPLLPGISQFHVDFVVPRLGVDLPVGIDPFLLFKSRDPELRGLHDILMDAINSGIRLAREGKLDEVRKLFKFPEAWEIGFGYAQVKGKRGSGVGEYLTELIIQTILDSPELMRDGMRHIEEFQLLASGIGRDRISDIVANLLKEYLITYTVKQCQVYGVPLEKEVPLAHIYDANSKSWYDGYFSLPISPVDDLAMLFVPRRIVRSLPWINYDDFFRSEFSAFLRAKQVKARLAGDALITEGVQGSDKPQIAAAARKELGSVRRYVRHKEEQARDAQPTMGYLDLSATCKEAEEFKAALANISTGAADSTKYQHLILEILNFLFNPELIDGQLEVRTVDGTERRDIIFTNDSDQSFWDYVRNEHSSIFIMFEIKNVAEIEAAHINQTSGYLGDRVGRLGFIVTRNPLPDSQVKKTYLVYNDSNPRKIIIVLSDADIIEMLNMKCKGNDPMRFMQNRYRHFRTSVQ